MKKNLLKILKITTIITLVSFFMDSDTKEPNMLMRFVELILMIVIVFIIISFVYCSFNLIRRSFQKI